MNKKIVIIGGGPAGIAAARAATAAGADVTLISNAPVGGRAGWHSLLPSKVWLTASETLARLQEADRLGLHGESGLDAGDVLVRLRQVKQAWNQQNLDELKAAGVTLLEGVAAFAAPDTVTVRNKDGEKIVTLGGDAFIVTTGSVPIFPPDMRPNGRQIIAPRFASALDTLPATIAVVGGGATGSEFAYLFNRLGVEVTWIVDELGVLPDFDREAAQLLADTLVQRGVRLVQGQRAERIDTLAEGVQIVLADGTAYEAAKAFLAIGRRPDVAGLNLEAADLPLTNGSVTVDEYGRSHQPHIYFAGDVTGTPMIANKGMAQGWVAGLHAAGQEPETYTPQAMIAAIYTEPEVAQAGTLSGDGIAVVHVPFHAGLKAHLLPEGDGFVKVAYAVANGRITGAAAVGPHAADVLAPLAVAIRANLSLAQLGMLYGAHPTLSELAFTAARRGILAGHT